jgi:hypothetical protein
MTPLEWLRWLTDKKKFGIPLTVMAEHCHCSAPSLKKLLDGNQQLTDRMQYLIEQGVQEVINEFKEKLGE